MLPRKFLPRAPCGGAIVPVPTKDELRLEMKRRVRVLDAVASVEICRVISQDDAWKAARLVAAFLPIPGEPRISPLLENKTVCVPRVRGEKCDLVMLPRDLAEADWRLHGADFDALPAVDFALVDLILVPGLAFTRDGARLGRGGGYYDRLLANIPARTHRIGVCFAAQILATLPTEPHDQRVERVITESGFAA